MYMTFHMEESPSSGINHWLSVHGQAGPVSARLLHSNVRQYFSQFSTEKNCTFVDDNFNRYYDYDILLPILSQSQIYS